jgi:DNA-binding MarR family transcriptional regulator
LFGRWCVLPCLLRDANHHFDCRFATSGINPAKPIATTEADVLAYVTERLEAGETLPSQAAIVKRFRVPKQTVSRWLGRWEAAGLLARTRDGRRNLISSTN